MKEIKKYAYTGITPEELSFTKNSMAQADALEYETAGQQANFLKRIITYKLDKDYINNHNINITIILQ